MKIDFFATRYGKQLSSSVYLAAMQDIRNRIIACGTDAPRRTITWIKPTLVVKTFSFSVHAAYSLPRYAEILRLKNGY